MHSVRQITVALETELIGGYSADRMAGFHFVEVMAGNAAFLTHGLVNTQRYLTQGGNGRCLIGVAPGTALGQLDWVLRAVVRVMTTITQRQVFTLEVGFDTALNGLDFILMARRAHSALIYAE
jgi:hypothetical protein